MHAVVWGHVHSAVLCELLFTNWLFILCLSAAFPNAVHGKALGVVEGPSE